MVKPAFFGPFSKKVEKPISEVEKSLSQNNSLVKITCQETMSLFNYYVANIIENGDIFITIYKIIVFIIENGHTFLKGWF